MLILSLILLSFIIGGIVCILRGIYKFSFDSFLFGLLTVVICSIILAIIEAYKIYVIT